MTYRERIEKTREKGFLTGINGISPTDSEKLPTLYHDRKYKSSDNYLKMVYAYEYYRGQDERRDRTGENKEPVDPRKPIVLKLVKKAESAFRYGMEAREHTEHPFWLADQRLMGMFDAMNDENERMNMLDAYLAGFHMADEETPKEEKYELDYIRMKGMREMYLSEDEPEPGTEAATAYNSYCECLKLLDFHGCDRYEQCLICPGKYRLLGDRQDRYGSEEYYNCEEDCADADRCISDICYDYIGDLEDYFIVPKETEK